MTCTHQYSQHRVLVTLDKILDQGRILYFNDGYKKLYTLRNGFLFLRYTTCTAPTSINCIKKRAGYGENRTWKKM